MTIEPGATAITVDSPYRPSRKAAGINCEMSAAGDLMMSVAGSTAISFAITCPV